MKAGRPLRFLAATLGGWTFGRIATLWRTIDSLPTFVAALAPQVIATPMPKLAAARPDHGYATQIISIRHASHSRAIAIVALDAPAPTETGTRSSADGQASAMPPPLLSPVSLTPLARAPKRLTASAYMLARGGANGTLTGGQLGGSQAGLRLTYALGRARHIAIAARLATPLGGRGREAGIGLDWQPTRLPFHVIAEQRFSLDGGRGGPTIELVGGYGPASIAPGIRLEAYAQGGAIARDGMEGFVDAAARLTHQLTRGTVALDIGAGSWGSAQRGAARIDIGPSIGLAVPIGAKIIRTTLDWRQRVAGSARPGSGPALTIGSDF